LWEKGRNAPETWGRGSFSGSVTSCKDRQREMIRKKEFESVRCESGSPVEVDDGELREKDWRRFFCKAGSAKLVD
jgi:hypothetical protein